MSETHSLFQEGVAALQAGQTDKARRILARAIAADPANEHAWLFLSLTLPDDKAADALERALRLNPANPSARAALDAINKRLHPAAPVLALGDTPTQPLKVRPATPLTAPRLVLSADPAFAPYDPAQPQALPRAEVEADPMALFQPKPPEAEAEAAAFALPDWLRDEPQTDEADDAGPIFRNDPNYKAIPPVQDDAVWADSADGSYDPDPVAQVLPTGMARRTRPMLNDDVRRQLDADLREVRRRKRASGPAVVLLLLGGLLVAILGAFVIMSVSSSAKIAATPAPVADLPTAALASVAPTATAYPTATAGTLLPTPTPLPPPVDVAAILGQEVSVDGYVVRPEVFSPNSPDFSALGADPAVRGTHYEGVTVLVANRSDKVLPLAVGFFQAVDDKNQRVAVTQKGRLPVLDVQRLQPGEQRRAWLTFAVANGATLRTVIFQASSARATIDVTQTVKTTQTPKAGTKTPAPTDGSLGTANDAPPPGTRAATDLAIAPRIAVGDKAQAGGFALTVASYAAMLPTNVLPRLLPVGYHYEIVRVDVENSTNATDAATILSRTAAAFVLRDDVGNLYTQGPLETTARFRYEDFAAANGKPGKTKVSGSLYFLVRDNAGTGRVLEFYPSTDYDVQRTEVTIK